MSSGKSVRRNPNTSPHHAGPGGPLGAPRRLGGLPTASGRRRPCGCAALDAASGPGLSPPARSDSGAADRSSPHRGTTGHHGRDPGHRPSPGTLSGWWRCRLGAIRPEPRRGSGGASGHCPHRRRQGGRGAGCGLAADGLSQRSRPFIPHRGRQPGGRGAPSSACRGGAARARSGSASWSSTPRTSSACSTPRARSCIRPRRWNVC